MESMLQALGLQAKPLTIRLYEMSKALPSDDEIRKTLLEFKESPTFNKDKHGYYVKELWEKTKPLGRDDPYVPSYERYDQKQSILQKLVDTFVQ